MKDEKDISEFAGAWSDMREEDLEEIRESIKKHREGFAKSAAKREKELYGK